MKKVTQTSDFSRVTNADLIVLARALGALPGLEYDPAAKDMLARIEAALDRPVGYVLPVDSTYRRDDKVKVSFPIPGLGRAVDVWCRITGIASDGRLAVELMYSERESAHLVGPDRVVEHRPQVSA